MWVLWILAVAILGLVYSIVHGSKSKGVGKTVWKGVSRYGGYMVPLGYALLMGYFLYEFHRHCLPMLQSKWHRRFIPFNYPIPFICLIWGVFSDPGFITKSNHSHVESLFPYDRILFMPYKECTSCHFEKPARSKHCSTCNGCIALADHHCLFLNRCIGASNFRQFVAFLLSSLYIFVYGGILTSSILLRLIPSLLDQGLHGKALFWAILRAAPAYRAAACMLILCILLGIIDTVFIVAQAKYVYLGATTNEVTKWEDVNELIDDGKLYAYLLPPEVNQTILLQKVDDGTWHRALNAQEERLIQKYDAPLLNVKNHDAIKNIYDQGPRQNFLLRFYPPDLNKYSRPA